MVHFIGIKYKDDGHELTSVEKRALDVVKVMYNYSRSRYAKIHKIHEFKIVFMYVYTSNDEDEPDKSILEWIFDAESKIIAKDRVKFAESFNVMYKRLTSEEDGDKSS